MWKVLIIDDEKAVRDLVLASLRSLDIEFQEGTTGLEALNACREWKPDLLILDVILTNTGIDGIEAARMIKRNRQTHNTKILLISGNVQLRSEEIEALGVEGVLAKPFEPQRMRKLVCHLLDMKKKKAV